MPHMCSAVVLDKNSIIIDYLAGTSIGAVVAAAYAARHSASEIEEEFTKIS